MHTQKYTFLFSSLTNFIGVNTTSTLSDLVYHYNGTSWTVQGTFISRHNYGTLGGVAPDVNAIAMQATGVTNTCDVWDGVAWASSGTMVTSVEAGGGGMTAS